MDGNSRAGRRFGLAAAASCCMALWIAGAPPAFAQATAPTSPPGVVNMPVGENHCGTRQPGDTRPRIGLALGGGGARGVAHISVLREIEALHIPIDCVAGTSMGSLVGGLYAAGVSVDDMEKLVLSTDWNQLFDDKLARPERSYRRKQDDRVGLATVGIGVSGGKVRVSPGLLQGERILGMFEKETLGVSAIEDFNKLPIPYRAVATDLNTGEAVILDHGSLAMAMRASMSLPGVFQPAQLEGRVLLDGGVANQVPIDVVRGMGADIVIAVDVGTPLEKLDADASILQVVSQISGMLTVGNTKRMLATLGPNDVLITPELGSQVTTSDFAKAPEALEIGRVAAEKARPALARFSESAALYDTAVAARPQPSKEAPIIRFVHLDNQTQYADEYILGRLDVPLNEPLDTARIGDRVLKVYSVGTFASVTYEVVQENGQTGLLVHARAKPHGPNYLQLGLLVSADLSGSYTSSLRGAMLISPLTPYGAEGRVGVSLGNEPSLWGEYYHPFDVANRWLGYVRLGYDNPNINVFDEDSHLVATYDVRTYGLTTRLGREYGNYGTAGIGYEYAMGHADVQVGDPALPTYDFNTGRAFLFADVDRLDSLFFPRNGYGASMNYKVAREAIGSDTDYSQFEFDFIGAKALSDTPHAFQVGASYHVTLEGTLPVQDRYRLGGRGHLVGFRQNELTGQDYAVVFVGYTYQLAEVFGRSALVGGTLEYGNAWENRSDMSWSDGIVNASMYIGFDSWVGPMMFGYGWREGGDGVVFIEIGKTF